MSRRISRVESGLDLTEFLDRGHSAKHENRWTFEVAWEVANKGRPTQYSLNMEIKLKIFPSSWWYLYSNPI